MPDQYFDLVFSWAVFDVVDQKKALLEAHRILKVGGRLFFTGKNDNYFQDDQLAFTAEKNAFLKGFPNRFTNLPKLIHYLTQSGFKLDLLYLFPRRGDMGIDVFEVHTENEFSTLAGYEYLISCSKTSEMPTVPHFDAGKIDMESSRTANLLARLSGYSNCHDYFYSLGLESS
jgi:SAM-dependent methyltransferase